MKKALIYVITLVMAGCIGDGPNDSGWICSEMVEIGLRYKYDDPSSMGTLADVTGSMEVYIFDAHTGTPAGMFELYAAQIAAGSVSIELLPGEYTFVAWGASADGLERDGYTVSPAGTADFRLALSDPRSFGELFHAIASGVTVRERENATVSLDFIRHTNLLHVIVNDAVQTRADTPIEIYVKGKKGMYSYDGEICADAEEHIYPSSNNGTDGGRVTCDVRLLRLCKDFHSANPVMLHVERDGEPLFEPQDIVRLLTATGYNTQDDFDRAYEHTIELGVDPVTLQITVTINGFTIVYPTPGEVIVINPDEEKN